MGIAISPLSFGIQSPSLCLCYQRNQASLRYPPSARFGRLGFLDHFFCKHSRLFGLFHPFCVNKKLKTHLREHSRQSPVLKIRSCFLSEFSGNGRTCFFFFLWFAFFLLFQKKEERNERKNKVVFFCTIYPSYII